MSNILSLSSIKNGYLVETEGFLQGGTQYAKTEGEAVSLILKDLFERFYYTVLNPTTQVDDGTPSEEWASIESALGRFMLVERPKLIAKLKKDVEAANKEFEEQPTSEEQKQVITAEGLQDV